MIEAEIKARLANAGAVRERLDAWAHGSSETYADAYFDTPDGRLAARGQELRLRTVKGSRGTRHILTFKGRPLDEVTQSKPEFEVLIEDPEAGAAILDGLGFPKDIAFTKECVNYDLEFDSRQFQVTVVTVPEIDGVFLEAETQADESDLDDALQAVRAILVKLGVGESEWTADTYTGAVRAARLGP